MLTPLVALAVMTAGPAILLWEGGAPGALGKRDADIPTLTQYLPEKPCGTAVVVCPGGGYGMLADHEGKDYALYLNTLGVTAYVLKYRLGSDGYRDPIIGQDALRAIRKVRSLGPYSAVGIMGSSAGGHLTATAVTRGDGGDSKAADPIDRLSSRADFGILCYPVITMGPLGHSGSKVNLLGENATPQQIEFASAERHVTAQTPPCFLWHTVEDGAVPVQNSLMFAAALKEAHVPFELHLYEKGPHGIGLQDKPPFAHVHPWATELARWLRERHWAN